MLILEALDGVGLELYGYIVWYSTYLLTLSSSLFVMHWVEKPGIYYLIERLVEQYYYFSFVACKSWFLIRWLLILLFFFFLVQKTAFTSKKYYGKEDRAAKWVLSQRSLQGLMSVDLEANGRRSRRSSLIAEQAMRRAEIAR